jgi:hypothetical protein
MAQFVCQYVDPADQIVNRRVVVAARLIASVLQLLVLYVGKQSGMP